MLLTNEVRGTVSTIELKKTKPTPGFQEQSTELYVLYLLQLAALC
jgi:hypothetical protein